MNIMYFGGKYIWVEINGDEIQYSLQKKLRNFVKYVYDKMNLIKDLSENYLLKKDLFDKKD